MTVHILNNRCPRLTLCGRPSHCSNYRWGRIVIDSSICNECVASFHKKTVGAMYGVL